MKKALSAYIGVVVGFGVRQALVVVKRRVFVEREVVVWVRRAEA